jgi:putative DNA primase/helicase
MIKETTTVNQPITENIPEELTERPQWVCWRYEERDGKMTKVPYTDTGWRASTTDLLTWTTCAMAYRYYQDGHCDGIGFVFSSADPFVGIDLDDCRDPETGEIAPWAQRIMDRVQEGYVEVSVSGHGVHIIVEGSVRDGGMRKGKVEMYSRGRFFTMTGRTL